MPDSEPLSCSTIVYRAIRSSWVDAVTKQIQPSAFVRRPAPNDDDGLSVDICSAQSCSMALKKCKVASLHVGRLRDAGLDVIIDDSPHANITGVLREIDNRTEAIRLSVELARQARLVAPESYGSA